MYRRLRRIVATMVRGASLGTGWGLLCIESKYDERLHTSHWYCRIHYSRITGAGGSQRLHSERTASVKCWQTGTDMAQIVSATLGPFTSPRVTSV